MKISREPALIISAVGAVVAYLVSVGLDAGLGTAIVGFVTALIVAAFTRPIGPSVFTAVVAAGAPLAAYFGLHWTDAQVGAVGGVILAAFALFGIRPAVTPKSDPAPTALPSGAGSVR